MNVKAVALSAGILWGFLLFAFTLVEASRGVGNMLNLLSAVYPGSVVGLVYGFVSAALGGAAFGWLYNRVAGTPREAEKELV